MGDAVVRHESAVEYFKELVEDALARQRVTAGELTSFYVVNLLAGYVRQPAGGWTALGPRLVEALDGTGVVQRVNLKQIGDESLFVSGFFPDSLRRSQVDVDYYVSIGGAAYAALSRNETDIWSSVFAELAGSFVRFVDVLTEVSERSSCSSDLDLVRLYERWLKTGSPRSARLLRDRGVTPAAPGKNLVH